MDQPLSSRNITSPLEDGIGPVGEAMNAALDQQDSSGAVDGSRGGRALTALAITRDNLHLSEPTPLAAVTATPATPIDCTDPMVLHFIEAATAPNTRRAYDGDLKHFLAWGGSLPVSPNVVARYLAAHATSHVVATVARPLGRNPPRPRPTKLPDPVQSELVRG